MSDSPWPNFAYTELRCKCGQCDSTGREMDPAYMSRLQRLREAYGQPMPLASAYRCARHPSEASKSAPGEHFDGRAVDVHCRGAEALHLLRLALPLGFNRIGIHQKGDARFLHLGWASAGGRLPSPAIWSY
ncbi:D-Ala-D-Ala carboxypeptidase family metallohydrolase [Pseudomonas marginalis]|uniref:D-Ala-D-Ala carboxypeptidase family metallohydrolase n=1 Tax=Pseudomonas marginalis TaxID=298 RepID=UPI002033DEF5|nr:D-Ala-D-Ala carboxypeptidase family metallohydrolase [Pseudomonas marginalis]MCM2377850.1 D-Ala-D-Ala carboxypeptidase family metallohydrolase [Pseudomonas marginalis]